LFDLLAKDPRTRARAGRLKTPHGVVNTPAFMPVGTQGTVKSLTVQDLKACGAEMILGNVYHLSLRPGQKVLEAAGGLHKFIAWDGPILTDSGGYQVFSLATLRKVNDDGVTFSSHIDGAVHRLTPENVVDFQLKVGSDVVIPLDECVRFPAERQDAEEALERTARWARRSKEAVDKGVGSSGQLLFGILQGATYPELRRRAAEQIVPVGFDGHALGGFCVGEPRELTMEILAETTAALPEGKPRYLMGVGEPLDVVDAVIQGVDMFDCVIPTRHGRNGLAYTWEGRVNLRHAAHVTDASPIDPACECEACRTHSRMYVRHLFQTHELLGLRLLSFHNLWFYGKLMLKIRQAVADGTLLDLRARLAAAYGGEKTTVEGFVR
jgi:queuine tRNA-ribosyltransferase